MKTIENNGLEKFSLNFSSWASRDVVPLMLLKRTISLMKCPVSDRFPESIRLILKFISGNILAVLVNFSVGNESEPDKKLNISAFNWKFWPARRILEREGSVLLQKKSFPPYCEIISYLTWSSCCMKEIWGVLSSNAYFLNKRDGQKKKDAQATRVGPWESGRKSISPCTHVLYFLFSLNGRHLCPWFQAEVRLLSMEVANISVRLFSWC